jgi:hypothetical protein
MRSKSASVTFRAGALACLWGRQVPCPAWPSRRLAGTKSLSLRRPRANHSPGQRKVSGSTWRFAPSASNGSSPRCPAAATPTGRPSQTPAFAQCRSLASSCHVSAGIRGRPPGPRLLLSDLPALATGASPRARCKEACRGRPLVAILGLSEPVARLPSTIGHDCQIYYFIESLGGDHIRCRPYPLLARSVLASRYLLAYFAQH